jgi:hypothetical protein
MVVNKNYSYMEEYKLYKIKYKNYKSMIYSRKTTRKLE